MHRLTLLLTAGLFLAVPALSQASIIRNPKEACRFLALHAVGQEPVSANQAQKISGFLGGLYVDPRSAIAKTGHIPKIPLISTIPPGKGSEGCVALSPTFLGTSMTRTGREWLWLVGIAVTKHKEVYQEAATAANHPMLRRVAVFFGAGGGKTKRAILQSECKASGWLHSPAKVEQEFRLIEGDLAAGKAYLPSNQEQMKEIRKCSGG